MYCKSIFCPSCSEKINPLNEDYFKDEYLDDSIHSEIKCKKCGKDFAINTHLNVSFEIETLPFY